jgi:hypothetical protein
MLSCILSVPVRIYGILREMPDGESVKTFIEAPVAKTLNKADTFADVRILPSY